MRFLNCLLLDVAVIGLMSIVRVDKFWVKIVKNVEMRTSGGVVVSDFRHPRRGEEGDQKGPLSHMTTWLGTAVQFRYCSMGGWSVRSRDLPMVVFHVQLNN